MYHVPLLLKKTLLNKTSSIPRYFRLTELSSGKMSLCLARLKQYSILTRPIRMASFKMNFSSRNVIKTLESRGMLEDIFPKESVHSLGEVTDGLEAG